LSQLVNPLNWSQKTKNSLLKKCYVFHNSFEVFFTMIFNSFLNSRRKNLKLYTVILTPSWKINFLKQFYQKSFSKKKILLKWFSRIFLRPRSYGRWTGFLSCPRPFNYSTHLWTISSLKSNVCGLTSQHMRKEKEMNRFNFNHKVFFFIFVCVCIWTGRNY